MAADLLSKRTTNACVMKAVALSRMGFALTRAQLQECSKKQREGEMLLEHEQYALSFRSWTASTEEKLAVLIFEDLQNNEGLEYTPVVVSGADLAAHAKLQVGIYKVRAAFVCMVSCCIV